MIAKISFVPGRVILCILIWVFVTASKKDFEKMERKNLAPYAVKSSQSLGSEFPETEDLTRSAFQRDRDRIIHSKPFRRLSGKRRFLWQLTAIIFATG